MIRRHSCGLFCTPGLNLTLVTLVVLGTYAGTARLGFEYAEWKVKEVHRDTYKFVLEEIYGLIGKNSKRLGYLGELSVRGLHHARPHKTTHPFCPLCFPKLEEALKKVPVERDHRPEVAAQDAPPILEELETIAGLLRGHKAGLGIARDSAMQLLHYLEKHKHKAGFDCPVCNKLRDEQETVYEYVLELRMYPPIDPKAEQMEGDRD